MNYIFMYAFQFLEFSKETDKNKEGVLVIIVPKLIIVWDINKKLDISDSIMHSIASAPNNFHPFIERCIKEIKDIYLEKLQENF